MMKFFIVTCLSSTTALLQVQQLNRAINTPSLDSVMTLVTTFSKTSAPGHPAAFKYTLGYSGVVQSAQPLVAFGFKIIAATTEGKQITWFRRDFNFTTAINVKRPSSLRDGVPFNPPVNGEPVSGKFNVIGPTILTNAVVMLSCAVDINGMVFGDTVEAQDRFFSKESAAAAAIDRYLTELRSIGGSKTPAARSALQARYPAHPPEFQLAEAQIGMDLFNGMNQIRGGLEPAGVVARLIASASRQAEVCFSRFHLSRWRWLRRRPRVPPGLKAARTIARSCRWTASR